MKIINIDLKENGKKYFCKQANEVFEVEKGNLTPTTRRFSMAELLEMDFEEIEEMKNPYKQAGYGERYHCIYGYTIHLNTDSNHEIDNKLFSTANYFNNKEYAEYVGFKETLMRKLDRFAWEHNAKVSNWDVSSGPVYYIGLDRCDKKLAVCGAHMFRASDIYFTSQGIAEQAIEEFKDDLIKLYTWKFDL